MHIVGLGNPGNKYDTNRHNVGKMFVMFYKDKIPVAEISWKKDSSGNFLYVKHEKIILAHPNTYMNLSGIAVGKFVKQFSIEPEKNLFVAHDDLDIALGNFKIDFAKGPKLHNGIDSVEEHLGTKDFYRIRIGVDNRDPANRIVGETYVLQNFKEDEMQTLERVFGDIVKRLQDI